MRQRENAITRVRASVASKIIKNFKASVSKWSRHNEHSHNAINISWTKTWSRCRGSVVAYPALNNCVILLRVKKIYCTWEFTFQQDGRGSNSGHDGHQAGRLGQVNIQRRLRMSSLHSLYLAAILGQDARPFATCSTTRTPGRSSTEPLSPGSRCGFDPFLGTQFCKNLGIQC